MNCPYQTAPLPNHTPPDYPRACTPTSHQRAAYLVTVSNPFAHLRGKFLNIHQSAPIRGMYPANQRPLLTPSLTSPVPFQFFPQLISAPYQLPPVLRCLPHWMGVGSDGEGAGTYPASGGGSGQRGRAGQPYSSLSVGKSPVGSMCAVR